jgi:hypothetical protein
MLKLGLIIFFLLYGATLLNISSCYLRYRDLWPEEAGTDLIARIQAIIRIAPEPDAKLSDECKAALVRLKQAVLISIGMTLVGVVLILSLKFFGVEIPE